MNDLTRRRDLTGVRLQLAAAVALLLFVAAIIPVPELSGVPTGVSMDLGLHALGATAFTLTLAPVFHELDWSNPVVSVSVVAVGYTTILELLHYVISYRLFSILDIAVNTVGVAVGIGLYVIVSSNYRFP